MFSSVIVIACFFMRILTKHDMACSIAAFEAVCVRGVEVTYILC